MTTSTESRGETPQSPLECSWRLLIVAWLVLTPVVVFAGFQQIFSTFASYDDEGYVMLSLVSYQDGKPLYDETYSQYGPFFFSHSPPFIALRACLSVMTLAA